MFRQRGFTLIEAVVVVCIVLILAAVAIPFLAGVPLSNGSITYGVNGITESRCIEGYKFIIDQSGNARQILDEFGKGARCEQISRPGGM